MCSTAMRACAPQAPCGGLEVDEVDRIEDPFHSEQKTRNEQRREPDLSNLVQGA